MKTIVAGLPDVANTARVVDGLVGMARSNDPNSANSQFFIMYDDGAFLNGKYTVVGEVVDIDEADASLQSPQYAWVAPAQVAGLLCLTVPEAYGGAGADFGYSAIVVQEMARAGATERNDTARHTVKLMLQSAEAARQANHFVCSDAGVPVFFVKVGTQARFEGNVRQAITDGFAQLVASIQPPLLPHVTNPLTLERGHAGKGMPIVTFDLVDDCDYVELICSPKALGSGRWAALQIFSFPDLATIEKFVIETVITAGAQICPPAVVGVGIGGTFDYAAKMAKEGTLRPIGQRHPEPMVAAMKLKSSTASPTRWPSRRAMSTSFRRIAVRSAM